MPLNQVLNNCVIIIELKLQIINGKTEEQTDKGLSLHCLRLAIFSMNLRLSLNRENAQTTGLGDR